MAVSSVLVRDSRLQALINSYQTRLSFTATTSVPQRKLSFLTANSRVKAGSSFVIGGVLYEVNSDTAIAPSDTIGVASSGYRLVALQFNIRNLTFRSSLDRAESGDWRTIRTGTIGGAYIRDPLEENRFTQESNQYPVFYNDDDTQSTHYDLFIPNESVTGGQDAQFIFQGGKNGCQFNFSYGSFNFVRRPSGTILREKEDVRIIQTAQFTSENETILFSGNASVLGTEAYPGIYFIPPEAILYYQFVHTPPFSAGEEYRRTYFITWTEF